jgi:alpha-tubulin suppressor-like RCC1 family protein
MHWHRKVNPVRGLDNYGETNVPSGLSNVIAIAAGYEHSIALKADGTVTVWGSNDYGQTNVPADLSNVVAVAGSYFDTICLKSDGTVLVWGDNSYDQTNVPAGLSNVVAVSAGFYDNMALKCDGTVVAWGGGPSSVTNVPSDLTNAVAIDCSMSFSVEHSLALRNDGTVTTWGYTQAPVPSGLTNVFAIAAGGVQEADPAVSRDLALQTDGSLVGWGGTTNLPTNLSNIIAIASGEFHQVALIGKGLPNQSALMTNTFWSGTNFSVQIPTQSGRVYALQYKNYLSDSNWTALPLVAGNGGMITLQDCSNTNNQRFYRVERW